MIEYCFKNDYLSFDQLNIWSVMIDIYFFIVVATPPSHAEQWSTFLSPDYYVIHEANGWNVSNVVRLRQTIISN